MGIINKIKHWFWWNFKATESDKALWSIVTYGTTMMKNGKFINPKKFINQ